MRVMDNGPQGTNESEGRDGTGRRSAENTTNNQNVGSYTACEHYPGIQDNPDAASACPSSWFPIPDENGVITVKGGKKPFPKATLAMTVLFAAAIAASAILFVSSCSTTTFSSAPVWTTEQFIDMCPQNTETVEPQGASAVDGVERAIHAYVYENTERKGEPEFSLRFFKCKSEVDAAAMFSSQTAAAAELPGKTQDSYREGKNFKSYSLVAENEWKYFANAGDTFYALSAPLEHMRDAKGYVETMGLT